MDKLNLDRRLEMLLPLFSDFGVKLFSQINELFGTVRLKGWNYYETTQIWNEMLRCRIIIPSVRCDEMLHHKVSSQCKESISFGGCLVPEQCCRSCTKWGRVCINRFNEILWDFCILIHSADREQTFTFFPRSFTGTMRWLA